METNRISNSDEDLKVQLDEWTALMKEAKNMGLTVEQVRSFLDQRKEEIMASLA